MYIKTYRIGLSQRENNWRASGSEFKILKYSYIYFVYMINYYYLKKEAITDTQHIKMQIFTTL